MLGLYLRSVLLNGGNNLRGANAFRSVCFRRGYALPIPKKLKQFNDQLNKITDENLQASITTLKYLRLIGGFSIIVVLSSILWASTLTEPVREEITIPDLGKDVRN